MATGKIDKSETAHANVTLQLQLQQQQSVGKHAFPSGTKTII